MSSHFATDYARRCLGYSPGPAYLSHWRDYGRIGEVGFVTTISANVLALADGRCGNRVVSLKMHCHGYDLEPTRSRRC